MQHIREYKGNNMIYKTLDTFLCEYGKLTAMKHISGRPINGKPIKNKYIVHVKNNIDKSEITQEYATAEKMFKFYGECMRRFIVEQLGNNERRVLIKHRGKDRFDNAFETPTLEMVAEFYKKSSYSVYASKPVSACCRRSSMLETDNYFDALQFYKRKEKQLWPNEKVR